MAGNRAVWGERQGIYLNRSHPYSLLLSAFLSFCSAIFWPIIQTSFCLFHLKNITFDLNRFCSYCSCFLLFMKFLNTARFSSLFCERPHSVQLSVCCSPTQVLAELQNQPAISSLFTLSGISGMWSGLPFLAWPCSYPWVFLQHNCHCSVSVSLESVLGPCVSELCTELCARVQQQLHLWLYVQFSHVHMISR